MPELRPLLYILGLMLLALGGAMGILAAGTLVAHEADWAAFASSAAVTAFMGGILALGHRGFEMRLNVKQGFVLTTASWLTVSAFGALPFLLSDLGLDYSDAFFETISGLTTTGSTILVGLDTAPRGILLWRGILQWLGGIGIIMMAILMLPFLRVGGMQLFHMESSDRSEKVLPRAAQIGTAVTAIYVALTVVCAIAYRVAGMTGFEAVVHSMTTLATGGYSTSDQSIAHFDSAAVEWIAVAFMVLGSLPFVLYVHLLRRRSTQRLWRDSQVRAFLSFLGLVTLAVTAWLWTVHDLSLAMALRRAAFNVTSVVTTTGYASADFGSWGQFALLAFLLLIFAGGCTGSTAGAVKTFRFQMLRLLLRRRLFQLAHPHAVFAPKYNGRMVSDDVLAGAAEFVVIYVAAAAILAMALSLFGLDIVTSLSGAATALGNVGPGLGPLIGPSGTFASLPDGAKWLLSLGMLLGRLELFTVLVLFAPQFWRI